MSGEGLDQNEDAVREAMRRLQEGAARLSVVPRRPGSVGGDAAEILGGLVDPFAPVYMDEERYAEPEKRAGYREAQAAAHDFAERARIGKAEVEAANAEVVEAQDCLLAKRDASSPEELAKLEDRVRRAHKAQDAALRSNALEVEDDRSGLVEVVSRNFVIEPTYHPAVLEALVHHNSVLLPLVSAMEVNVPGTGWELVPRDTQAAEDELEGPGADASDEERERFDAAARAARDAAEAEVRRRLEEVRGFFDQPWPGMSWTTVRRKLRRDLHSGGNAYLEVMRDSDGFVVAVRPVDHKLMRLVRLDAPALVTKSVRRGSKVVEFPAWVRERRFVQQVGGGASLPHSEAQQNAGTDPSSTATAVDAGRLLTGQGLRVNYFREFGSARQLDKWTGQWAAVGEDVPEERRATEIIHLKDQPDPNTPYGVPRWIAALPSVLGMRRGEESNLAYFRAGGIPPLLIMVLGGLMGEKAKAELEELLNGQNPAAKHQAAILEMVGGRMDQSSNVDVKVEAFGSARAEDAMFMQYDERTAKRTREAFRLPPLFLGDVAAFNFNTARLSVMTAEAQVFEPERQEEDEALSNRILEALPDGENFTFLSKPLVVDDAELQRKCIEMAAKASLLSGEEVVRALNKVCNLDLRFDQEGHERAQRDRREAARAMAEGLAGRTPGAGVRPGEQADEQADEGDEDLEKSELRGLAALGVEMYEAMAGDPGTDIDDVMEELAKLSPEDRRSVREAAAAAAYGSEREDLVKLLGCVAAVAGAAR